MAARFSRYALPSDDLAATADTVVGSAEDSEYPAENIIAPTNTGHRNLPSRPAKLTTTSGTFTLTFPAPISVGAMALPYHNLDAALDVTLEPDGGTPIAITIPAHMENGWPISPFKEFDAQSSDEWVLSINGTNSLDVQVGRLMLFTSLRDLGRDVRWGVIEDEEQGQIEHTTVGGVETLYELFGPRRGLSGEFHITDAQAASLITLYRSARHRILPWLLIPDTAINDAWIVRFLENKWSREWNNPDHNLFQLRVKELSRGLPWP